MFFNIVTAWAQTDEDILKNVDSYRDRGYGYYDHGKFDEAAADFTKAIGILQTTKALDGSRLVQLYVQRGLSYDYQGRFTEAIDDFSKAVEIIPTHSGAYYSRGLAYVAEKDFNKALADFDRVIQLIESRSNPKLYGAYNFREDPRLAAAYVSRGAVFGLQKNFDKALSDYNKALELNPKYVLALNNLGFLYEKQGRLDEALNFFRQAISIDPQGASAYSGLALVYFDKKDYPTAQMNLNKARQLGGKPDKDFVDKLEKASGWNI